MSRLNITPRLGLADPALMREMRDHAMQVNLLADGRLAAVTNAATAAPTTGTHARGDFLRNSAPAELGSASSKYVIFGWICVTGGTPGTWLQCRFLTGN
jgi:hypothetical protein